MKTHVQFIIFALTLALIGCSASKQSSKSFYKQGEKYYEAGTYNEAVNQYTEALKLEPQNEKVLLARAKAYKQLGQTEKAIKDYDQLVSLEPKDAEISYEAGKLYYEAGDYEKASNLLIRATSLDHNMVKAYQINIVSLAKLKKFEIALQEAELALDYKKDALNYYNRGFVEDSLGMLDKAEDDYRKAVKKGDSFEEAMVALADLLYRKGELEEAQEYCEKAIEVNKESKDAYIVRAKIHRKKLDYPNALNDLSRILVFAPEDLEVYFLRGQYNEEFKQFQNAIFDYTKVIALDETNLTAYFKRAQCYEEIKNYEAAIRDYKVLNDLAEDNEQYTELLDNAEKRMFELNREHNKPEITLISPVVDKDNFLEIRENAQEVVIKGELKDESNIASFRINGNEVKVNEKPGKKGYVFEHSLQLLEKPEEINFVAVDGYGNESNETYNVALTEINPPKFRLKAPVASDNGEIYLSNLDPILYVEGYVRDQSQIKSILIDGSTASYRIDDLNPNFSANIDITNKDNFTITVEDKYGNKSQKEYTLNREGATLAENNPMGKTWVIFIENSDYETFASIDGPTKDVTLMKSALANYIVHNMIHKKNMSKTDLERFFAIELRDLVRSNKVNSLIVWYAGHGKTLNETGYWIPVDAKRDDEFTYFNINSLKASMQSYSDDITHTLVITDACESGPSFYQAMRSTPTVRSCDDRTATRFKSSQVFSSAGYELATDDSQFTRTFANTLKYNEDTCIPIEEIVLKVTDAVAREGKQKPQFGKIAGLEDENGTFFFIRK